MRNRPSCLLPFAALLAALVSAGCEREEGAAREPAPPPVAAPPPGEERAAEARGETGCDAVPDADALRRLLREAPGQGEAGGLAGGRKEWAAVVNRAGELCAVAVSTDDPAEPWPGSQQVAKAKAYTANAFSTDDTPLSTARLYTLAQPGHSLYGLAASNPLHPECLAAPEAHDDLGGERVCGGIITFGGGVPLYRDGRRVGGLGASGDTACADHEIAKRMRDAAGLNPPGGALADDITYSGPDGASAFTHPLCANTWRNQQKIGDEAPAAGY